MTANHYQYVSESKFPEFFTNQHQSYHLSSIDNFSDNRTQEFPKKSLSGSNIIPNDPAFIYQQLSFPDPALQKFQATSDSPSLSMTPIHPPVVSKDSGYVTLDDCDHASNSDRIQLSSESSPSERYIQSVSLNQISRNGGAQHLSKLPTQSDRQQLNLIASNSFPLNTDIALYPSGSTSSRLPTIPEQQHTTSIGERGRELIDFGLMGASQKEMISRLSAHLNTVDREQFTKG
ncbi:hypothetical protein HK096_011526, partial [Nowakowskiella sp. JEL0078]